MWRWLIPFTLSVGCVAVERAEPGAFVPPADGAVGQPSTQDGGPDQAARPDLGSMDSGATPDSRLVPDASVDAGRVDAAAADAGEPEPDAGGSDAGRACAPGTSEACGVITGACEAGFRTCGPDGVFGPCMDAVGPAPEACNGVDDDCDGVTDEATGGGPCEAVVEGCVAAGELRCLDGAPLCEVLPVQAAEVCDGLDQDCDGRVDEAAACALPGAEAVCADAACAVEACELGRYDFDRVAENGCEEVFIPGAPRGLGPAVAGPVGQAGPGGVGWTWGTEAALVLRTPTGTRDLELDGPCEGVALAATDEIYVAACRAEGACSVLRSDGPTQRLACSGPPGVTGRAGEAGVFTIVGTDLRWTSVQPLGLPVARSQGVEFVPSVRPFPFVHDGALHAVAVRQIANNRREAVIVRVEGEAIVLTGRRERGDWAHVAYFAQPDGQRAVLALHGDLTIQHRYGRPAEIIGGDDVAGVGTNVAAGIVLGPPVGFTSPRGDLWISRLLTPGRGRLSFTVTSVGRRLTGVVQVEDPVFEGAEAVHLAPGAPGEALAFFRRAGRGQFVVVRLR